MFVSDLLVQGFGVPVDYNEIDLLVDLHAEAGLRLQAVHQDGHASKEIERSERKNTQEAELWLGL